MRRERRDSRSSLFWGLFLMGLGVLFLLERMGVVEGGLLRRAWPLWPALFGVGSLIKPRRAKDVGDGIFMLGIGAYLLVSNERLYGLDWHSSWPLILVALGLSQVARVIAASWLPDTRVVIEEKHDV